MEISFYHLSHKKVEDALPQLLEKTLEIDKKAVIQVDDKLRIDFLNSYLWSYRDDSFIPHGCLDDGNQAVQPVFLTDDDSNPNSANMRFLLDGTKVDDLEPYERVIYLFDDYDEDVKDKIRSFWREYKTTDNQVTYWKQETSGKWVNKG